ncbi:Oxygen-independent coproporphyrinogen-III oxidase 1 [candidate division SR1 bacterium Aalborg_AAW-1]|nr:Oxygen-independent coproporphyrinogen-III oxidase 1 [candidate division SR1 bacterium Aalborg_AAW-1]
MLSLYIHIPFCYHKCGYCSFNVIPLTSLNQEPAPLITSYLDALHRQIDDFATKLGDQEIKTIYFGGGTPSIIGSQEMIKLIDHIGQVWKLDYLEELSIEINPDPVDDMLELIQTISKHYKNFPRVRFSIGIQSFDNEVLEESGRQYNFQACVDFLRKLTKVRMDHNIFNFDFIAFGKFNTTRKGDIQLRDPAKLDFFQNFVESEFADSFSLYTLELFEGSAWFNQQIANHNYEKAGFGLKKYGTDDDVYAEFELLKNIILDAGYQRYEISNYSRSGANSIHNRVYRAMDERLGLGTGATSHLKQENLARIIPDLLLTTQHGALHSGHISIVPDLKRFTAGTRIDEKKTELLSETDFLKEKFLMGMRTMDGVIIDEQARKEIYQAYLLQSSQTEILQTFTEHHLAPMTTLLVDNREEKIELYEEQGLCECNGVSLKLTDTGMDVYNSIITELME